MACIDTNGLFDTQLIRENIVPWPESEEVISVIGVYIIVTPKTLNLYNRILTSPLTRLKYFSCSLFLTYFLFYHP